MIAFIFYRILGILFVIAILLGMAGYGITRKAPQSYIAAMKRIQSFAEGNRVYATQRNREIGKSLDLWQDRQQDQQDRLRDQLENQRFKIARLNDQRKQSVSGSNSAEYMQQMKERLNDQRYKSMDNQNQYRRITNPRF